MPVNRTVARRPEVRRPVDPRTDVARGAPPPSGAPTPPGPRGFARAVAADERRLEALRDRRAREHEALLHAARRVFVTRGYRRTRVQDVLREAGISTRALYRFHAGKDELFLELFARASDAALERLRATVARRNGALARLDAYVDATIELAYDPCYQAETRLFASLPAELTVRHADEVRACRERLVAVLVEILDAGRASGELGDVDPEVDAWALHGAMAGVLTRVLTDGPAMPRARVARRLRRLCRAAVLPVADTDQAATRALRARNGSSMKR
jgi:AcrR family transcriptional regulator